MKIHLWDYHYNACDYVRVRFQKIPKKEFSHLEPSMQAMQFFNLNRIFSVGLVKNNDTTL